jgi:hypothetical protein
MILTHVIRGFSSQRLRNVIYVAQGGTLSELDGVALALRTGRHLAFGFHVTSRAWLSAYATLFFRGRWVFKRAVKRPPGRVPL